MVSENFSLILLKFFAPKPTKARIIIMFKNFYILKF